MGLIINESIVTLEGTDLSMFYIRIVKVELKPCGKKVFVEWASYASDASFASGKSTIAKPNECSTFDYDRVVDGADLLSFAHTAVKDHLTTAQSELVPAKYAVENLTITDI